MNKSTSLFLSISIIFYSVIHTSEQRSFDWRPYVPSSTMSTVWPFNSTPIIWATLSMICTYGFFSRRYEKAQQAVRKKELLHQLRKYVYCADSNQFGPVDNGLYLAATDPEVVKFLPAGLNEDGVGQAQQKILAKRKTYLHSAEIWGEVQKAQSDSEFAQLTAEADEWNKLKGLRSQLPQLLAPAAYEMFQEQKRQNKHSRRETQLLQQYCDDDTKENVGPIRCENQDVWHKKYLKMGLENLGFKIVREEDLDALYQEYKNSINSTQNNRSIWGQAQAIAAAKDYGVPECLIQIAELWLEECQKSRFKQCESLHFKPTPSMSSDGLIYRCDIGTGDVSQLHTIDPTEFFYSPQFNAMSAESKATVNFSSNMELKYTLNLIKKHGLVEAFSIGTCGEDGKVCSSEEYVSTSSRVQQINRKIIDKYYRGAQKKGVEQQITEKKFTTAVEPDPETKFVDPWLCPRLFFPLYLCAKFIVGSNRVALSTSWFKSNVKSQDFYAERKKEEAAKLSRAQAYRNTYLKNLIKLQGTGTDVNSNINFVSVSQKCATFEQSHPLVEAIHNLSEALDSFNTLIKDDKPCAAIQARRAVVLHDNDTKAEKGSMNPFEQYLAVKDQSNLDGWFKQNQVSNWKCEKYYYKAFHNAHEQLAQAGKNLLYAWNDAKGDDAIINTATLYDVLGRYGVHTKILDDVWRTTRDGKRL